MSNRIEISDRELETYLRIKEFIEEMVIKRMI